MKKNLILIIIAFVMFMEAVDTTIINTAIPAMAYSLHVHPIHLKLALISYLLSLAIFIPISGWIADKFGVKNVFICAIVLFTLSSIWCGLAQDLWSLVIARVLQGIGGALTLPVGRLIIVRTSERHELISKMSFVVMIGSTGLMLGPLLGGIITEHYSWQWIFWVNVPIGLLTSVLAFKLLPAMPAIAVPRLDIMGFILFGCSLVGIISGLSMISEPHIPFLYPILTLIFAILLFISYVWHSRKITHPIVQANLLSIKTFRVSVLGNLFARIGFGGLPFALPLYLQIGLGFSPQLSGLLLVPIALAVFLGKPLSLPILRFFGYKKTLIINTILLSLSLWLFAYIEINTSIYAIGILTFIYGTFISLQYTGMSSLAYANIRPENFSAATSIMSTIQQLAQSLGVATAAILLNFFTTSPSILSIPTFHKTFYAMSIMTLIALVIFVQLNQQDGRELIEAPLN
jgi:EmrB/QacA subfamily drug resistance transporter